MEVNELRVGNFVWEEYGGLYEVININSEGFDYVDLRKPTFKAIGRYEMDSIKPIPLTEEWLLKFGFEKHKRFSNEYYELNEIEIQIHGDKFVLSVYGGESAPHLTQFYAHHTKHVHQLQNLYFALTGEELKLV